MVEKSSDWHFHGYTGVPGMDKGESWRRTFMVVEKGPENSRALQVQDPSMACYEQ